MGLLRVGFLEEQEDCNQERLEGPFSGKDERVTCANKLNSNVANTSQGAKNHETVYTPSSEIWKREIWKRGFIPLGCIDTRLPNSARV